MKERVPRARIAAVAAAISIACLLPARAVEGAPVLRNPKTGERAALVPGARATHLVFFAAWCPPCIDELPRLAELEARWGGAGYRLVLVAVKTRQTSERLASFVDERVPPGEMWFDEEGQAEKYWKADRLPTHIVLDASGGEVVRGGSLSPQVTAAIEQVLNAKSGGGTTDARPGSAR